MSGKNASSALKMMAVLTTVCILSGAILATIHTATEKPMAAAEQQARVEAIALVLPAFENNPIDMKAEISLPGQTRSFTVYPAFNKGKFVGAAVESYSMDGFSGEIKVIYGFNAEGTVTGYHVMSHNETPGLGAKMEEWFRMDEGHRSIIGINPATKNISVNKDGGDIDGITAATISSRAFLKALTEGLEAFETYKKRISHEIPKHNI